MLDLKIPPVLVLIVFAGIIVGIPCVFSFCMVRSMGLCVFYCIGHSNRIIRCMGVSEIKNNRQS